MSGRTIEVSLSDGVLEMLDYIAKAIGAESRAEAVRSMIRDKHRDLTTPQTGFDVGGLEIVPSLRGITDGNELTDEDFEGAKAIWEVDQ